MSDPFSRTFGALPWLGLGGGPLGNHSLAIDDEQAQATVARAWDRGIRYFDTAPHYGLGLAERRLGEALAGRPRDEFLVSSKVGRLIVPAATSRELDDDGFVVPGDLTREWDFSPSGVERSLDESLERLQLDRIDVLLAHDPDQAWPGAAREGLESLARLKDDGRVGAIGIGTNSVAGLRELIDDGALDVIMLANRYSLLRRDAVEPVLDPAAAAGVAVIAVGVFGTGLLATRRPVAGAAFEYQPAREADVRRAEALAEVCESFGVSLPTAALAYPLRHPAVAAVALGMRSPAEADENADRALVVSQGLPEELWPQLERVRAEG